MTIEPGALNQTHHRRTALARAKGTREQPVVAADGNRSYLVLDMVVVHGQLPVTQEARQHTPAPQAVIKCLGSGAAIRYLLPRQQQPRVQRVHQRF